MYGPDGVFDVGALPGVIKLIAQHLQQLHGLLLSVQLNSRAPLHRVDRQQAAGLPAPRNRPPAPNDAAADTATDATAYVRSIGMLCAALQSGFVPVLYTTDTLSDIPTPPLTPGADLTQLDAGVPMPFGGGSGQEGQAASEPAGVEVSTAASGKEEPAAARRSTAATACSPALGGTPSPDGRSPPPGGSGGGGGGGGRPSSGARVSGNSPAPAQPSQPAPAGGSGGRTSNRSGRGGGRHAAAGPTAQGVAPSPSPFAVAAGSPMSAAACASQGSAQTQHGAAPAKARQESMLRITFPPAKAAAVCCSGSPAATAAFTDRCSYLAAACVAPRATA